MKLAACVQVILSAAALSTAAGAAADSWKLGAGADYTSGEYGGTQEITTLYAPINLRYQNGRLGFRATVPYLEVNGPGTLIDEGGQLVPGPDRTESGLGDVVLGATLYDVVAMREQRFYVDLTAKVKLPTADEDKGLGTGETDYTVQGDWYKAFERASLFGAAGYKVYGDPADADLDNALLASLGGDYRIGRSVRAGVIYDYRESAVAGADSLQEVTIFASFSSGFVSFQPYLLAGLTDSSPDWGAGLMMSWRAR